MRWPWLRTQPAAPDELNEPDEQRRVWVPTRGRPTPTGYDEQEGVWATPEAADQWDARRWGNAP